MIIKDKTDANIERHKEKHGLTGDVYLINGVVIASLASHKKVFTESTATTIEEAEAERLAYDEAMKERIRQEAQEHGEDGDGGDDLH